MKTASIFGSQSIVIDTSRPTKIDVDIQHEQPEALAETEIRLSVRASPINPLDLAVINGIYPVRPQHQSSGKPIPGYDGVAEVIDVGRGCRGLTPGDFVIPSKHGIGMWRNFATVDENWVEKIPEPDDLQFGAIVKGSVMPAFFLIEDMVSLQPGNWVIQNAATSVIAQFVVQFARMKGAGTISVIRDRSANDLESVSSALDALGADVVLTESEFINGSSKIKDCNIVLAIDSVFGDSGGRMLRSLGQGGTYVQLGFLAGPAAQLNIGAQDLWAKQITMRAFRGATQLAQRSQQERKELVARLIGMFNKGLLALPSLGMEMINWDSNSGSGNMVKVEAAIAKAKTGDVGQRKQIIVFS